VSPSGGAIVDKPKGMTSHDVVARARRVFGTRSVGHAGTLDPMATGVLVLGVGEGTKLCGVLSGDDKEYEATLTFGAATSTDDAEGAVLERVDLPEALVRELSEVAGSEGGAFDPARAPLLAAALEAELARTEQVPPAVSAIHVDGERAHVRARRGETVELAPRAVRLRGVDVLGAGESTLSLRVRVSKGYYVRSLARDLGRALGVAAHLSALRRTRAGAFGLERAKPLDALDLVPLATFAAMALPTVTLDEEQTKFVRTGRAIELPDPPSSPFVLLSPEGRVVALAEAEGDRARVLRGIHDG